MGSYPSHFDYVTSTFATSGVLPYSRHHGQWAPYPGGTNHHYQHGNSNWFNNQLYLNQQHQQLHHQHQYPGTFSASSPALSNSYGMTHSPYVTMRGQYMYNSYPSTSYYNNSHGQPLYYGFR